MYSPKIRKKHIPILYRKAKALKIPMTELVDQIISEALREDQATANELGDGNKDSGDCDRIIKQRRSQ